MKFPFRHLAALALATGILHPATAQTIDDTVLMINEINYNPVGNDNSTTQEWIELYNHGNDPIDLAGYTVEAGNFPTFTFPAGATIASKGYVLLVGKVDEFLGQYNYGVDPDIVYHLNPPARSSQLSNASATISIFAPGETTPLDTVTYAAQPGADNVGPTLELIDPALDNSSAANWAVSTYNYGSPGKRNATSVDAQISNVSRNLEFPTTSDAITISADVASASPLGSVLLHVDTGSGFTASPMASTGGSYSATIPATGDDAFIKYYIEAIDGSGESVTFPDLAPIRPAGIHVSDTPVTDADLVINELMYNPAGSDNAAHSEFIELKNISNRPIDVSYFAVDRNNFDYIYVRLIPDGTIIPPGGHLVFAGRGEALKDKFPYLNPHLIVNGAWPEGTSVIVNGGGNVVLAHANSFDFEDYENTVPMDNVPFVAVAPWPVDANGYSIELIDPTQPNDDGSNWAATTLDRGTPGYTNTSQNTSNLDTIGAYLAPNQYPGFNEDVTLEATFTGGVDPITASLFFTTGDAFDTHIEAGVDPITPNYFLTGGYDFQSVPLTNNGSGTYVANLGSYSEYTTFEYFLIATDANGVSIIQPHPEAVFDRFIVEDDPVGENDIVINELMYDNQGGDNGTNSEWIEIYNRRSTPINMTWYQMGRAVDHADTILLPRGTVIDGNGFLVFAGKKAAFLAQYPTIDPNLVIDGGWSDGSKLGNSAGSPAIVHPNAVLFLGQPSVPFDIVRYGTDDPNSGTWPTGDGLSYQLKSSDLDNSIAENWLQSPAIGDETPAAPNMDSTITDWSIF